MIFEGKYEIQKKEKGKQSYQHSEITTLNSLVCIHVLSCISVTDICNVCDFYMRISIGT